MFFEILCFLKKIIWIDQNNNNSVRGSISQHQPAVLNVSRISTWITRRKSISDYKLNLFLDKSSEHRIVWLKWCVLKISLISELLIVTQCFITSDFRFLIFKKLWKTLAFHVHMIYLSSFCLFALFLHFFVQNCLFTHLI